MQIYLTSDVEHVQHSTTTEVPNNDSVILDELDLQRCVAHDICRFYSILTYCSEPIVVAPVKILEHVNSSPLRKAVP